MTALKKGYLYLVTNNEDQEAPGETFHCHEEGTLVECTQDSVGQDGTAGDVVSERGMSQIVYPEHVEEIGEIFTPEELAEGVNE
jgi:hypothetical protein